MRNGVAFREFDPAFEDPIEKMREVRTNAVIGHVAAVLRDLVKQLHDPRLRHASNRELVEWRGVAGKVAFRLDVGGWSPFSLLSLKKQLNHGTNQHARLLLGFLFVERGVLAKRDAGNKLADLLAHR